MPGTAMSLVIQNPVGNGFGIGFMDLGVHSGHSTDLGSTVVGGGVFPSSPRTVLPDSGHEASHSAPPASVPPTIKSKLRFSDLQAGVLP